jgi:hypothetical protein
MAAQVFLPGKKSVLEEIGLKAEEIVAGGDNKLTIGGNSA